MLAIRCPEARVSRRVPEPVRMLPRTRREFDGLGRRDVLLGKRERGRPAQDFHFAGIRLQQDDGARLPWRGGDHRGAATPYRDARDVGELRRDDFELTGRLANGAEAPHARIGERAQDSLVALDAVRGLAELPLRTSEFQVRPAETAQAHPVVAVEIPPAFRIGDEVEISIRTPLRLEHRLVPSAGHALGFEHTAIGIERRDPELGAVPGHVGMIPREPRESPSVGARPGIRVEIMAARQNGDRSAGAIDRDELVQRFPVGIGMVLANAHEPATLRIESNVRVAPGAGAREGLGLRSGGLVIQPIIAEVSEPDLAAHNRERAAAVFVHARSHVEGRRGDVRNVPVRRAPDEHVATLLRRTAFHPPDVRAVERNVAEADACGAQRRGGHRGFPLAVTRDVHESARLAHAGELCTDRGSIEWAHAEAHRT